MTRAITGLLALAVGIAVGLAATPSPPGWLDPYLPVAVVAAVDAAVGGLRAAFERVFSDRVFVVAFLTDVVLAVALVALGDALGVGGAMSTAVVVVLGIRIFTNASAVRRSLLKL